MVEMNNRYETWIWTELLAFDCEADDCGVQAYLERIGRVPDGISLLLSSMDFILDHHGMTEEYDLYADVCSRFGHSGNEERSRQQWTNFSLKKLIGNLHRHNIRVLAGVFILNMGNKFHNEYVSRHPEVRLGDKIYGIDNAISMLARLDDGTLFEDIFIGKLAETVLDYGFDGWHGSDGMGPGWNLTHSDSSDNFTMQFAEYIGKERIAPEYLAPAGNDEEKMSARIDYIWQNFHDEWADFTSRRWMSFWSKAAGAMHALGAVVMINSPFAKSIFESIFYFGMDYRELKDFKIDYLLTESVTTSCSLNYGEYERVFDFSAMIAEMRAVLPEMKLIVMPGVKDVVESYDALRHAPCRLARDIFANCNQSVWQDGRACRAADGYLVCLGDGLTTQEWAFLENIRKMSFDFEFDRAGEMAWLVSSQIFTPLRKQHTAYGIPPPYRFAARLAEKEALDISVAVTPEELDSCHLPLLVPLFDLYSDDVREKLFARRELTVLIGNVENVRLPLGAQSISWDAAPGYTLGCVILNSGKSGHVKLPAPGCAEPFDWKSTFYRYIKNRIPQMEIPDEFFAAIGAAVRAELPESPLKNPQDGIRLMRFFNGNKVTAALLSLNDIYSRAQFCVDEKSVSQLEKKSEFPYSPLQFSDGMLALKDHRSPLHLPPHGMTVFTFEQK